METDIIVILSIAACAVIGMVSRAVYVRYIQAHAAEWFQLSPAARSMLGVVDESTETGFYAKMKKSVAESGLVMDNVGGCFYNYNEIEHELVPGDIDYIRKNKNEVSIEDLHKKTGLYPERVEKLLRNNPHFRNITESEWGLIGTRYQMLLDRALAEENMIELSAERISAGYHNTQKKVVHTDVARKQLRSSPEEQWVEQYARDAELAH